MITVIRGWPIEHHDSMAIGVRNEGIFVKTPVVPDGWFRKLRLRDQGDANAVEKILAYIARNECEAGAA